LCTTGVDDFHDRVSDPAHVGTVQFVHGGQPAEHPRRHVLDVDAAMEIVLAFLRERRGSRCSAGWEKQDAFPPA